MTISVIITCKDKENFLTECIDSVLQQTRPPDRVILVHDGCSSPQSHLNTTTIILGNNGGVAHARDVGVRITKTSHLLFLDGDDALVPDYIEKMSFADADIVYPDFVWWYRHSGGEAQNKLNVTPEKLLAKSMIESCKIPVTCLIKKEVYTKLGGFNDYAIFEDYDFWLRAMVAQFKFVKANTILLYRQVNKSRNRQDQSLKMKTYAEITKKFEVRGTALCERSTRD